MFEKNWADIWSKKGANVEFDVRLNMGRDLGLE